MTLPTNAQNPSLPKFEVPLIEGQSTSKHWFRFFSGLSNGISVTIPVASLTVGGTQGSLVFTNGILTSSVNPT
jgi:hypothetical protein